MLIIPLTGKISKRNPPLVTALLIFINCFVYFIFQAEDQNYYQQAIEFYGSSGLGEMEVTQYDVYLKQTKKGEKTSSLGKPKKLSDAAMARLYMNMEGDQVFMEKLLGDEIIKPDDPNYSQWKELREEYKEKLSWVISVRYGLTPKEQSFLTTFTHMFLHGGFGHILGNMIFLWFVGCVLELGCGRVGYLGMYLFTGLISGTFFSFAYAGSMVPLVGASGAISGLIGAYTVLYGRRKIKIFYTVGFYFNYTMVPAIVLLPIWIGNEVFQLYFGGVSQVAYAAHIGGLASGALFGYLNQRFIGVVNEEVFAEDPKERIPSLLEKAMQSMGKLDMKGARPMLEQVLQIDPDNGKAMAYLFNIDKLDSAGEEYHKTATQLLSHLSNKKGMAEDLLRVYKDYCQISKRIKLPLNLLFRIGSAFSEQGYLEESERVMGLLLKTNPKFPKLPTGIIKLGRAYLKVGKVEKGKKCLLILCQKYPESLESGMAHKLLGEL